MDDKTIERFERALHNCPCCGKKAILNVYPARKGFEANVQCSNCFLSYTPHVSYDTEEEAVLECFNGWNRRVYL